MNKMKVTTKPVFMRTVHEGKDVIAGRMLPLGLTGYGDNMDEASDKIISMCKSLIRAHRSLDIMIDLEERLNDAGLDWEYVEEDYTPPKNEWRSVFEVVA